MGAPPTPRVVLLGASNVVRGFAVATATARAVLGVAAPEWMVAAGHGRSYGSASSVLGRRLPGILDCALWDDLETRPLAPTYALVTDVGNDVGYGFPAERIVAWVAECVARLLEHDARLVLTPPPRASLERLPAVGYYLLRSILYPTSRIRRREALSRVAEIERRLRDFAVERGVACVDLDPGWYGADPIHFRRRARRAAWAALLGPWGAPVTHIQPARTDRVRLWTLRPERRWLCGREQRRRQPAGPLPGGGELSLY